VADAVQGQETPKLDLPFDPGQMGKREFIELLIQEMKAAAENLEYERAASIRDRILELKGEI